MKYKFTIGEISRLFNINTTALRYYDEIDLFKPSYINKKNNYRYYTIDQFEYLNTIIYLKDLGVPLKEIKDAIENVNIQGLVNLFEKQQKITEQKIKDLNQINKKLQNRITQINDALNFDSLNQIKEIYFEDRNVIVLENRMKTLHDFEIAIRKMENSLNQSSSFFCGQVGFSVAKDKLINRDIHTEEYDSVFKLIEDDIEDAELLTLLPKGIYVCIRYNGVHKDAPKYYHQLLDYIEEKGYNILDDSVEIQYIDPNLTNNEKEYINEIQILVDKKY
ncbi:MAG: MerR family transcriptional regulator [Intestinibacter sp.]|uniref:MerR family transcriptional regulator n=1 Tax=Intestinibacter sp. TaxID=1965304 RepID=UPI002A8191A6|nr:MerR family transcriptional regulator [Intestinibacter sp.]MDY4574599.1 MerR family transcriptional regulator [Intestinibacter sp.]